MGPNNNQLPINRLDKMSRNQVTIVDTKDLQIRDGLMDLKLNHGINISAFSRKSILQSIQEFKEQLPDGR